MACTFKVSHCFPFWGLFLVITILFGQWFGFSGSLPCTHCPSPQIACEHRKNIRVCVCAYMCVCVCMHIMCVHVRSCVCACMCMCVHVQRHVFLKHMCFFKQKLKYLIEYC